MTTYRWYRETDGTYHRGWDDVEGIAHRESRKEWVWHLMDGNREVANGSKASLTEAQEECDNASNAYRYDHAFFMSRFAGDGYRTEREIEDKWQAAMERRHPNC